MAKGVTEPAGFYWAVGIALSVALHASGVAGAVLLADRYARPEAKPTEITFSDQASPKAAPAPAATETASDQAVAVEKLMPAAPRSAERPSPPVSPAAVAEAPNAGTEQLAALAPEPAQPLPPSAAAVRAAAAEREPPAAAETAATVQPSTAAAASAEAVSARDAVPAVQAESSVASAPTAASVGALAAETVRPATTDTASAALAADRPEPARIVSDSAPAPATAEVQRLASTVESEAAAVGTEPLPAAETSTAVANPSTAAVPPTERERAASLSGAVPAVAAETTTPAAGAEVVRPTAPAVLPESSAVSPSGPPTTVRPSDARQAEGIAAPSGAPDVLHPTVGAPVAGDGEAAPSSPPERVAAAAPSETLRGQSAQPAAPSSAGGRVTGAEPLPPEREVAQPVTPTVETALLVPARPGSSLGDEIDKPSDRYKRIVDFVRNYGGGDCFIALPAMSVDGVVTFQTFGRDKEREDAFTRSLVALDGLRAEISAGNVAETQCLALSFARSSTRYPGFSLMIDLDEADIGSGTRLSGAVLNARGREVHLLLIDDEGRVQSVDRFLSAGDGTDRPFSAPLVLTGKPVATKQILMAITAEPMLPTLSGPIDDAAATFFARLADEVKASGADVDLAVEGFSVR